MSGLRVGQLSRVYVIGRISGRRSARNQDLFFPVDSFGPVFFDISDHLPGQRSGARKDFDFFHFRNGNINHKRFEVSGRGHPIMGHQSLFTRPAIVPGNNIIIKAHAVDDGDMGEHPAGDTDAALSHDRVTVERNTSAFFAGGIPLFKIAAKDLVFLMPHADMMLNQPRLEIIEPSRIPPERTGKAVLYRDLHDMGLFAAVKPVGERPVCPRDGQG